MIRRPDLWRSVVIAGCAYEIVALVSDRVPTISEVVLAVSQHRVGRFAAWMFVGGWAAHYLAPPASPLSPTPEATVVVPR